ncbi:hypothetical protein CLV72_11211 [Allonocardiopsis opalescens]|uniref:Uncharacterized protein n=1 Tax=Allonocardiopsis opalescens TaxID=1144618 RepID=A0A2T0PT20_9ACTN|nr:hypothetical protein CLV72_11211 [Allonocardiopsis opalescens]
MCDPHAEEIGARISELLDEGWDLNLETLNGRLTVHLRQHPHTYTVTTGRHDTLLTQLRNLRAWVSEHERQRLQEAKEAYLKVLERWGPF